MDLTNDMDMIVADGSVGEDERMDIDGRELDYFLIDGAPGGDQDRFDDWMMNVGGCGAVTACDLCACLSRRDGFASLCPFDASNASCEDYIAFAMKMKQYLHPRWRGIDRLEIYLEGFGRYLRDHGFGSIELVALHASRPIEEARAALEAQIDAGIPVPFLLLRHSDPAFADLEWHWFNLAGYERGDEGYLATVVTYGKATKVDFDRLWETGRTQRGGLVLAKL